MNDTVTTVPTVLTCGTEVPYGRRPRSALRGWRNAALFLVRVAFRLWLVPFALARSNAARLASHLAPGSNETGCNLRSKGDAKRQPHFLDGTLAVTHQTN